MGREPRDGQSHGIDCTRSRCNIAQKARVRNIGIACTPSETDTALYRSTNSKIKAVDSHSYISQKCGLMRRD